MRPADHAYSVPNSLQFQREFDAVRTRICGVERQPSCHESARWDGGHFSPLGRSRPISVSIAEARLLAFAVDAPAARSVLEIGTGFGYSTSWLGFGAGLSGGHVVSIDDHSEGALGHEGARGAADFVAGSRVSESVSLVDGRSPDDLPSVFGDGALDFVFIDGNHNEDHPERDYRAVAGRFADSGVIVFHDVFWPASKRRNTVFRAVERAIADGFKMLEIDTSCQPLAASRSAESLQLVGIAFEASKRLTMSGNEPA